MRCPAVLAIPDALPGALFRGEGVPCWQGVEAEAVGGGALRGGSAPGAISGAAVEYDSAGIGNGFDVEGGALNGGCGGNIDG